jgi:type IV pilus assembly protein PilQ
VKKIYIITLALLISVVQANEPYRITNMAVDAKDGTTRLVITVPGLTEYTSFQMANPDRLGIQLHDVAMPEKPFVLDYPLPIKRVSLQPQADNRNGVGLTVEYSDKADYTIDKTDSSLIVEFSNFAGKMTEPPEDTAKPDWLSKRVNLVVEDGQISSALNLISREAGFDLVISDLDEKAIWLNLHQVLVEDAIKAILKASGNTYYVTGSVVVVTGRSENNREGLESRIYQLKYADAASFVDAVAGVLSPEANIKVIKPNTAQTAGENEHVSYLLLTDTPEKHDIVKGLISTIDVQPRQVAISVKFIETNISGETTLGLDWSKMLETSLTGADPFAVEGESGSNAGYAAYSSWPLKKGSFVYGTLTVSEAKAVLNYLSDSGKSRLLSDPSVTTSDGKKATISVTTTIPIQTINRFSEGAVIQDIVTFDYKEVGIILNVVPRINGDGRITLVCRPSVEEITGWVGPTNNQQPITTKRSVETEVVVTNGETVVIGGLYKEGKIEKESKLWLLGDIPVLGNLFKNKNTTTNKTDLMIFITPQLVE